MSSRIPITIAILAAVVVAKTTSVSRRAVMALAIVPVTPVELFMLVLAVVMVVLMQVAR
jgi:hypothetical protein